MNLYQDRIAGLDRNSVLSSSQLLWILIAWRGPFLPVDLQILKDLIFRFPLLPPSKAWPWDLRPLFPQLLKSNEIKLRSLIL